jgi:excisionase family DNA binding protein
MRSTQSSDPEAALRDAVLQFALAILAAVREAGPSQQGVPERLLSVAAAAQQLGVGRSTVYQLIAAGQLRSTVVGRRRLVPLSAITDFIATAGGARR